MEKIEQIVKILSILMIVLIVYDVYMKRDKKCRKVWVREVNKTRDKDGFFKKCFKEIKSKDEDHFFKATRMNVQTFNLLLGLLKQKLTKYCLRKPIEPENRLTVTIL